MGFFDWAHTSVQPVLKGRDILLRIPHAEDYRQWRDLRHASRSFLTPWEPAWTDTELTRAAYRARLRRYRLEARQRTGYTFFILDSGGKTLKGGLTLGRIQRGVSQSATLGYWMGEAFAGRGIMTQAVETVAVFGFDILGLHRLEAACLPTNARSTRLLEKSGFRREGHLRSYLKIAGVWEDHHLYSLLVEDWVARARPLMAAS